MRRLVAKIEQEGSSLQIVALLRLLPTSCDDNKNAHKARTKQVFLGSNAWMEFIEMSWTKAQGDGCPVYFYSVKKADDY